jgi:hypothetical protein
MSCGCREVVLEDDVSYVGSVSLSEGASQLLVRRRSNGQRFVMWSWTSTFDHSSDFVNRSHRLSRVT